MVTGKYQVFDPVSMSMEVWRLKAFHDFVCGCKRGPKDEIISIQGGIFGLCGKDLGEVIDE